jgi:hypothetical protein
MTVAPPSSVSALAGMRDASGRLDVSDAMQGSLLDLFA